MTALPGTPAIQNAIPMRYFGTTLFAAPILRILASGIIRGFGLWWLRVTEAHARKAGEGYAGTLRLLGSEALRMRLPPDRQDVACRGP
jgi:H+/gluconate symporter-like permease